MNDPYLEAKIAHLEYQLNESNDALARALVTSRDAVEIGHRLVTETDQLQASMVRSRKRMEALTERKPLLLDNLCFMALGMGIGGAWIGGQNWAALLTGLGSAGQVVSLVYWIKQYKGPKH